MTRFVLATANPDKAREIEDVLSEAAIDLELDLLRRPPDVPEVEETGETLEENARLKAVALCDETGLAAIADDTGLEVDALDGAPGVYSARYAGVHASYADNVRKLLAALEGTPTELRTARFSTVAIARWPDGREVAALGTVDGHISEVGRGEEGFGYDPVFVPTEGDGRSFAEMGPEKHRFSHRGRALRTLVDGLRAMEAVEQA